MRKKILFSTLLLVVIAAIYRFSVFTPELVGFSGPTMGTTYTVKFYTTEAIKRSQNLKDEVDAVLVTINKLMSTYDSTSELSRFNKLPSGGSADLSEDMAYVMDRALLISEMSQGEYDVTIGPLVNLWGFGPGNREDKVPSQDAIDEAKTRVGYHYLTLDGRHLTKQKNVYIDLSSIAKGYGVDRVAKTLEENGIESYLVEVGGEIRSKGVKPDGSAWKVAIESPAGGHTMAERIVSAKDIAIATSGDYRNYFEKNGVRYSHTINPVTGRPIAHHLVSVTVIDKTTTMADGLATAITVLGPDKGLEFAQKNGIAAYLLVKTDFGYEERPSDAFKPYM
ncbi:FAD:protein FMN transferase [Marinomonas transparens]|uniref:FAD:protein FMN transferase n=1 Tax=Marinomonas transparens TaxID=2795388 RepID=A0A934JX16_9GAMM|nr:FAD:protein FMN transferase [Marinomonas transparens]MBJ7538850.1 FAD:protein FMN transferase [Marinomonas transparens]